MLQFRIMSRVTIQESEEYLKSSNALEYREAVVRRCSVNEVFLEISQNSQENTCARVSFSIKLKAVPATLLKKRLWHRWFPVNFAKFLRTPFLTEHLWWLLLNIQAVWAL